MTVLRKPCECTKVIAFLAQLGARHAAAMHAAVLRGLVIDWSAQDWLLHMDEEERLLFPVLIRAGYQPLVTELLRDHVAFRTDLTRYGKILDVRTIHRHSDLEDELVLALAKAA